MHPAVSPSPPAPPFECDQRVLRVAVLTRQLALGLSQQDIAAQTDLSEPRLSRFLGPAQESPSDQTVNRLVNWLGLPLAYFNRDPAEVAEPARAVPAA
jgi:transcriptional regulator with XRE-family HTH domain